MANFTSKKMTLGVKSDIIMFFIMEFLNDRPYSVGGEVSSPND
jgi:hypothetical protein